MAVYLKIVNSPKLNPHQYFRLYGIMCVSPCSSLVADLLAVGTNDGQTVILERDPSGSGEGDSNSGAASEQWKFVAASSVNQPVRELKVGMTTSWALLQIVY